MLVWLTVRGKLASKCSSKKRLQQAGSAAGAALASDGSGSAS